MEKIEELQNQIADEEAKRLRQDGMKLREEYHRIIDEYINTHAISPELEEILTRGVYCGAGIKKGGILFTSVNPSYNKKKQVKEEDLPANLLIECIGKTHWQAYVDIAATFPINLVGYMDLFPLRESKQWEVFEKVVPNDLKANMLQLTIKKICEAEPKLIIHTNPTSSFYWGTKAESPWMGYELLPIEDERLSKKGRLYIIVGRTGDPRSVALDEKESENLVGSYLFIGRVKRGRYEKKEKFEPKRLNSCLLN